jgi:Protein of unknown function (DUF2934)
MLKKINRLPTEVEIRQRAQEIFLARGGRPGREIDDWLQAEYELTQLPVKQLAKLAAPKSKRTPLAVVKVAQAALLLGASGLMTLRS